MKDEKQKIVVLVCLVIVTIIVSVSSSLLNKKNDIKVMEKSIEEIGRRFYTEYLFINQKDIIENAIQKDRGIELSINSLLQFIRLDDNSQLENTSLFSKCDLIRSTIKFTPYEPIAAQNVNIDVVLDCKK